MPSLALAWGINKNMAPWGAKRLCRLNGLFVLIKSLEWLHTEKMFKNFNENPQELGIYANAFIPLISSLPQSLATCHSICNNLYRLPLIYHNKSAHAPTQNQFDTRPWWALIGPALSLQLRLGLRVTLERCPRDQRN